MIESGHFQQMDVILCQYTIEELSFFCGYYLRAAIVQGGFPEVKAMMSFTHGHEHFMSLLREQEKDEELDTALVSFLEGGMPVMVDGTRTSLQALGVTLADLKEGFKKQDRDGVRPSPQALASFLSKLLEDKGINAQVHVVGLDPTPVVDPSQLN